MNKKEEELFDRTWDVAGGVAFFLSIFVFLLIDILNLDYRGGYFILLIIGSYILYRGLKSGKK